MFTSIPHQYIYLLFYMSQWRRECLGDYHVALFGISTVRIVSPTAYASRRRTEDIHALIYKSSYRSGWKTIQFVQREN